MIRSFAEFETTSGPRVVFASMAGCPHCIEFEPMVFDASFRTPVPIFKAGDDFHPQLRARFGEFVQGFPTLLFVDVNGGVSVFNHQRTPQNVADWIAILANKQVQEPTSFIL